MMNPTEFFRAHDEAMAQAKATVKPIVEEVTVDEGMCASVEELILSAKYTDDEI